MSFNKEQINNISKYFSDLSKILFASVIIGYFVPSALGPIITLPVLVGSSIVAVVCVVLSINMLK